MIEKCFSADIAPAVTLRPPSPRHEPPPGARTGYAWVAGFWDWRNDRHAWVEGRWIAERRGYRWQNHRWVQRDGQWFLQYGGWAPEVTPSLALPPAVRRQSIAQQMK